MFKKPYIIAEIGSSHMGNDNLAFETIRQAKLGGADCVKFQIYKGETIVHPKLRTLKYIKFNKYKYQIDRFNKMSISIDRLKNFYNYSKKINIDFCVTPFDPFLVKELSKYVKFFKVASGDLNYYQLLNEIKKTNKFVMLSTGMSTYKDIENSIKILKKNKIIIMHCVSSYPTIKKNINLSNITELYKHFKIPVGFSDHTTGIDAPIQAIAYGARVIEKHFVPLKGSRKSADYPLSINYKQLKEMKKKIKTAFEMIGKKKNKVLPCELYGEKNLKRSIYSKCDIKKGEKITLENIICIRPYKKSGLKIEVLNKILGQKAKRDILINSLIKKTDIIK